MTYIERYPTNGAQAVEDWLHDLDLAGPFAGLECLADLAAAAPDPTDATARHLAGFVAGRRGQIPAKHRDIRLMEGVWAGLDLLPPAGGRA